MKSSQMVKIFKLATKRTERKRSQLFSFHFHSAFDEIMPKRNELNNKMKMKWKRSDEKLKIKNLKRRKNDKKNLNYIFPSRYLNEIQIGMDVLRRLHQ